MNRSLPAEWAPQSGVMLSWPDPDSDWGPILEPVETVFTAIVRAITRFQTVLLCVAPARLERLRRRLLEAGIAASRLRLFGVDYDDTWVRDYGPITVLENGRPLLLDFSFDGWGGKYPAGRDNRVSRALHGAGAFGDTPMQTLELVLEGGSIDSDGQGTLLTTRSCLLAGGRNPGLSPAGLENQLRRQLGVQRIIWLEHGHLEGDDTDGHVDTLARFCDAETIAYMRCDDPNDAHYDGLQAMEAELRALRQANGQPYRLRPLPWPEPRHDAQGRRLPASYANFLIINGAVLLPTYRSPASDQAAVATLARCFPGREIIAIDCLPLIEQNGSLHCLSMHLPAGVLPS